MALVADATQNRPALVERLSALAPRAAFEAVFAGVTLYAARPAFASLHLPLQDLPQHMAAISVLKRYAFDPGLREYFVLTLSRTQYLLVYLLGVILSIPFRVEYATRLLAALTVISIPYALRFALKRTGGDERYAVLAWPFLWNPQMMFGFLNYLLGIPVALVAIGLFADLEKRTARRRQIALAALALCAFYSHLIAYGLLGLGVLLMLDVDRVRARVVESWTSTDGPFRSRLSVAAPAGARALPEQLKQWARELTFLAPSFVAVAVWIVRSPARDASVRAGGVGQQIVLTWPDRIHLPDEFRADILDVVMNRTLPEPSPFGSHGPATTTVVNAGMFALIAWGMCLLAALALARSTPDDATESRVSPSLARVGWLAFFCALLYVFSPASYGWIWPIHTRFAVAAVLLLPLAIGRTKSRVVPWLIVAAMAWSAIGISRDLSLAFQDSDRSEIGDLDEALSHARPGRRLVALLSPERSRYLPGIVPLLHVAAYYQVRGGDVATFSFADFPQSPFRYRDDGPRPPRLRPRWEWQASLRDADPNLDYYDYVLAHVGYADEAAQLPDRYQRIFAGEQWNLYERRR